MSETPHSMHDSAEPLPEGLQLLLSRLENVVPVGRQVWQATCPRHRQGETLEIRVFRHSPWLYCRSGCRQEEVLGAVGMSLAEASRGIHGSAPGRDPVAAYLRGWNGDGLEPEATAPESEAEEDDDLDLDENDGFYSDPGEYFRRARPAHREQAWETPLPFHEHPLPDFPVEALPEPLAAWVTAEAASTQTPPDLSGMLLLAAVATACAGRYELEVRDDWVEPLNLFIAVSLPPGERKSAVFAHVTAPLEAWEAEAARRGVPAVAAAQSELKILEVRLQRTQQAAARALGADRAALEAEAAALAREIAAKQLPTLPRLLVDDTSPERLASLLREQDGRMAVLSPEGGVFDLMAGRYAAGGLPNFEVFLKGHAGDPLRVDRVGRPAEYVPRPALTLGLALQPDVLRGLTDRPGFRGRGLLGRFLYALPPSRMGARKTQTPEMPAGVRSAYGQRLLTLLGPPDLRRAGTGPEPETLTLDPEARARLYAFAEWLEPELGPHGNLRPIADWAGKLAGAIVRIAGLLHLVEHSGNPETLPFPVGPDAMERAVTLGRYLIPHARAAFQEMGADPDLDDARYLLEVIRRRDARQFTRRDLFTWARGRFRRVEGLDPALRLLEQHAYVRPRETQREVRAGRPASPVYQVNPDVFHARAETHPDRLRE